MKIGCWVALSTVAVVLCGCEADSNPDGKLEDQRIVADMPSAQTVQLGRRTTIEVEIPPNVLPTRQPLTVNVRTDVVRRGATPVGQTIEFLPAGATFTAPVRVRQPLPAPQPNRHYAVWESFPSSSEWVKRGRGRKLLTGVATEEGHEIWELDADSSGFWMFAEELDEEPVVDAGSTDANVVPPVDAPLTPALLQASRVNLDFGDVVIGTNAPSAAISITNAGQSSSGVIHISLPADTFLQAQGTDCEGADLASGTSCSVAIIAMPSTTGGASGTLTITSASGATLSIPLSVTGINAPSLKGATNKLTFKSAPADALGEALTATLTNTGDLPTGPITLAIEGTDAASFTLAVGNCTAALAKQKSCTATITFVPKKVGALTAVLKASASPGGNTTIDLAAQGLPLDQGAKLSFTEPDPMQSQVNFNETATNMCSNEITFTVANTGAYASEPLAFTFAGTDADDFQLTTTDGCTGKRLAIGANCSLVLHMCANNFGLHYATVSVAAKATTGASRNLYGYSY